MNQYFTSITKKLNLKKSLPLKNLKGPINKENYGPVSLLSYKSKVFGRLLYKQIETFMSHEISIKLFGFRKNYNT